MNVIIATLCSIVPVLPTCSLVTYFNFFLRRERGFRNAVGLAGRQRQNLKQFAFSDVKFRNQKFRKFILTHVIITELSCSIDYPVCTTLMNPVLDSDVGGGY